jgi:hypothetical protein
MKFIIEDDSGHSFEVKSDDVDADRLWLEIDEDGGDIAYGPLARTSASRSQVRDLRDALTKWLGDVIVFPLHHPSNPKGEWPSIAPRSMPLHGYAIVPGDESRCPNCRHTLRQHIDNMGNCECCNGGRSSFEDHFRG